MPSRPEVHPDRWSADALLEGPRRVKVTRVGEHQDALAGAAGPVVAELAFCTIDVGRYRGRRGVEVRLDGRRVGELTHTLSERYAALVSAVLNEGRTPTCAAEVHNVDGEAEMDVLLPEPDDAPPPVEPATEELRHVHGDAYDPTALVPRQRDHRGAWSSSSSEPTSLVRVDALRPSGAEARRAGWAGGWRKPHWIAAGAAAAVVAVVGIVLASSGGSQPATLSLGAPTSAPVTTSPSGLPERAEEVAARAVAPATTTPRRVVTQAPVVATPVDPVPETTATTTTAPPTTTAPTTASTTRRAAGAATCDAGADHRSWRDRTCAPGADGG